jgi:hypothetical protein
MQRMVFHTTAGAGGVDAGAGITGVVIDAAGAFISIDSDAATGIATFKLHVAADG